MIVSVTYLFHDYEPAAFLVDTDLLGDSRFEQDVKTRLLGATASDYIICLDGNVYGDEWARNLLSARVAPPRQVDKVAILHVQFE